LKNNKYKGRRIPAPLLFPPPEIVVCKFSRDRLDIEDCKAC